MSVYIDAASNRLGRMVMCHMIADTQAELHSMAQAIGLRREWYQQSPPASSPHYDVSKQRRAKAMQLGCIELGRVAFVAKLQELRAKGWP